MHQLSRPDARQIAVRAQLLDATRPTDLLATVRHLTFLQLDPVAAVAPAADLVVWSRLGSAYRPPQLDQAVADRSLIELLAFLRPAEDLRLFRAEMAAWGGSEGQPSWAVERWQWVEANDACRRDVLDRLRRNGPLPSRELPDTCVVPWTSTGWTHDKNITQLLTFLARRGEVAVAGRSGRERLWDLAERVYPDDPVVPAEEAVRIRDERRLRSLGLARPRGPDSLMEQTFVGEAGEPAVVEGVRGTWRVDPEQVRRLDRPFFGRVALLSPFDRLVHDRKRLAELFGFEYQLEMYKPVTQRRWGYYALPILSGDALVGKLDAVADRKAGLLRVNGLHPDVPFDADTTAGVRAEVADLARWLGLEASWTA